MSIVTLRLPDFKRETKTRPWNCPYCIRNDHATLGQGEETSAGYTNSEYNPHIDTDAAAADVPSDIILKVLNGLTRRYDCESLLHYAGW